MTQPPITQQVTFIYTTDLAAGSDFMANKVGLELVLNQFDICHIFRAAPNAFIGVCTNRPPPEAPGVTYTFVTPDAVSSAISDADNTLPFLKLMPSVRTEWARTAPCADATSISPNIICPDPIATPWSFQP